MKALNRGRHTGKNEYKASYAGIDRRVMLSESFRAVGPNAKLVLLWLAFQYKGSNNGYLSATRNQAKKDWGIGGADTLARALKELQDHCLIVLTRHGRFMNPGGTPNLFALTWEPIHEKAGDPLDVPPSRVPLRKEWDRKIKIAAPCPVSEYIAPVSGHSHA